MTIQAISSHTQVITAQPADFLPTRILEIELSQAFTDLPVTRDLWDHPYQKAMGIVRLHTRPLGSIEFLLNEGTLSAQAQSDLIWKALAEQINEHLLQDGLDPLTHLDKQGISSQVAPACLVQRKQFLLQAPFASIVVATHNRPDRLQRCLQALLTLDYPRYEIIIVDNAPDSSATADFIQQTYQDTPQVRYVREDRPGLSLARNCGIQAAKGEIIAITDDDVLVDTNWLLELVRGFQASKEVVCVSGLVLPMEMETQTQAWFEQYGGYSKGFKRCLFDMNTHRPGTPLFPYTTGRIGTGANIAFKADYLRSIGGFDPTLGTGTLAQGGEDLAILLQVLIQKHMIVYEPAALLYHPNRRDYADLRKQIYCYGVGLTAYLMKIIMDQPIRIFDIAWRFPYGLFFALSTHSLKNQHKSADYPKELAKLELQGMLYGPLACLRSRWAFHTAQKAVIS